MSDEQAVKIERLPIVDAPVNAAPIPEENVVSGSPEAFAAILWRNEAGTLFNGVWHCTPGSFYLDHADETVALIEGRATVTGPDGVAVELAAGDVGYFPGGQRVLWEVHETVRKAFHMHDAEGKLLGGGDAE